MFLMVMLHYSFYTKYYSNGIAGTLVTVMCVVCVPLFFAVNGALLLPQPLDEHLHYRKVLNIVIIVSIWKVLATIFFIFVDSSQTVTIKDFCIFLLGGNLVGYPTGYFWFMNALIALYLILPLVKMAFDSDRSIVLHTLMAVLFGFTVGKDTVSLVLQGIGTLTHHDFASIVNPIDEYYIFGSYGYVLLYFLVGGLIGRRLVHGLEMGAAHGGVQISQSMAVCGVMVCYAVTVLVQRYQHAVKGVVLTVENGYWLLPTFVATLLILFALGRVRMRGFGAEMFQAIGMNTFGIYMLHMAGLILLSRAQDTSLFNGLGNLNSIALTAVNVLLCICIFVGCLFITVLLRKIPFIEKLFAL